MSTAFVTNGFRFVTDLHKFAPNEIPGGFNPEDPNEITSEIT